MLKFKFIFLLIVSSLIFSNCSKEKTREGEKDQYLAVLFVSGPAMVKKEEALKPEPLKAGMLLASQDTIATGKNSTLKIRTENGSVLIFRDYSYMKISSIIKTETQQEIDTIRLNWGTLTSNVRVRGKGSYYSVETPEVQVKTKGNIFTLNSFGGKTDIFLKDGEVEVKPIFKNKELEEKISGITLFPGYQVTYTSKDILELEKKFDEKMKSLGANPSAADLLKAQENFQKEFTMVAKPVKYDYLNDLMEQLPMDSIKSGKIEIGKKGEIVYKQSGNKLAIHPVTITAYGSEISINDTEPHKDFYSAIYPANTQFKITVKSPDKTLLQQELTLGEKGFEFNQTSEQALTDIYNRLIDEKSKKPFFLITENFKEKPEKIYKYNDQIIISDKNNLKVFSISDKNKQPVVIPLNPLVKPAVNAEAIFAVSGNNFNAYGLNGEKKGGIAAGNITSDFTITAQNDIAYLGDNDGLVKGIDKTGKDVYYYQITGEVTSPVSAKEDLLAFTGKQMVYLQREKKRYSFKNDFEMKYSIGLMEEKLVIPQGENNVSINDLNGKQLVSINTTAGNIKTLTLNLFAILAQNSLRIYNINGSFVKAIYSKNYAVTDKKIIYSSRNKVYFCEFNGSESHIDLPENIYLIGLGKNEAVALTENGKIFQINY